MGFPKIPGSHCLSIFFEDSQKKGADEDSRNPVMERYNFFPFRPIMKIKGERGKKKEKER